MSLYGTVPQFEDPAITIDIWIRSGLWFQDISRILSKPAGLQVNHPQEAPRCVAQGLITPEAGPSRSLLLLVSGCSAENYHHFRLPGPKGSPQQWLVVPQLGRTTSPQKLQGSKNNASKIPRCGGKARRSQRLDASQMIVDLLKRENYTVSMRWFRNLQVVMGAAHPSWWGPESRNDSFKNQYKNYFYQALRTFLLSLTIPEFLNLLIFTQKAWGVSWESPKS